MSEPSQPSVAGKLTESEKFALGKALYVAIERTQWVNDEHPIIPAVESLLAEREASLRADLAAAILAQVIPFDYPAAVAHNDACCHAARIVRTTEGTGGETA